MAKKIKNPIQLTVTLMFHTDGTPHVDITEASIHYGIDCEHGSLGRKGAPVSHTSTMLNAIKDYFEEAIDNANIQESIPEVVYGDVQWESEPEPD